MLTKAVAAPHGRVFSTDGCRLQHAALVACVVFSTGGCPSRDPCLSSQAPAGGGCNICIHARHLQHRRVLVAARGIGGTHHQHCCSSLSIGGRFLTQDLCPLCVAPWPKCHSTPPCDRIILQLHLPVGGLRRGLRHRANPCQHISSPAVASTIADRRSQHRHRHPPPPPRGTVSREHYTAPSFSTSGCRSRQPLLPDVAYTVAAGNNTAHRLIAADL